MPQQLVTEDRRRKEIGRVVARDPRCKSRYVGSEALELECVSLNDKSWLLRKARVAVKDIDLTLRLEVANRPGAPAAPGRPH